jgi:uncharacterized protein YkwD
MIRTLLILSLLLIAGCDTLEPVYQQEINKDYLQLLHNIERGKRDLPQFMFDSDLDEYAQKHAEWMAQRRSLTHSKLKGLKYRYRGENIAYNQKTEEEVVKAWMNSRGHKKNILNPNFTHVGFGAAKNRKGQIYWCAVFGGT